MDLRTRLDAIEAGSGPLTSSPEHVHLLQQYHEKLNDFKTELRPIQQMVLTTGVQPTDALFDTISKHDKGTFNAMLKLKKLLYPSKDSADTPSDPSPTTHEVRLPKLDVPTSDGGVLKWTTFWEQFAVAVHDRTHLSNAENLAYLKYSLKEGVAKGIIKELSKSGYQYDEAIKNSPVDHNGDMYKA